MCDPGSLPSAPLPELKGWISGHNLVQEMQPASACSSVSFPLRLGGRSCGCVRQAPPLAALPRGLGWASGKSARGCKEQRTLVLTPVIRGVIKKLQGNFTASVAPPAGSSGNQSKKQCQKPSLPLLTTCGQSVCLSLCLQVSWHIPSAGHPPSWPLPGSSTHCLPAVPSDPSRESDWSQASQWAGWLRIRFYPLVQSALPGRDSGRQ